MTRGGGEKENWGKLAIIGVIGGEKQYF